jgi:RNA recognition motif-containing protein
MVYDIGSARRTLVDACPFVCTVLLGRAGSVPCEIEALSMKLYIGNLSFQTTSEDLREHFSQAGAVESALVIEDRETNRSRGFGFVEFASAEDGNKAIEMFHGTELNGRTLTVNEARPREDRGDRPRGGGYGGGGGRRGGGGGYGGGGGRGGGSRW